jgi:osmotically-inducible protein OsmY
MIGVFVLSTALTGGAAMAQEKERGRAQMQQPSQQEMTKRHDEAIKDQVVMRLARSSSLAGTDIQVAVENQTVSLSGTVGSEQEQQRAIRLARRVRGVKEVKDELSIDKAAVDQRRNVDVGDEELAKQVAQKLANETFPGAEAEEEWFFGWEIDGYNWEFDVDVDDGVVTLEGDVDSYGDISDAIQAARAVPGVRAVESELSVDFSHYPYYGYPSYGYPYYGYPYYGGAYYGGPYYAHP